ncbi:hypothetical protein IFO70_17135 [Phormidium tenue FACHB-886]|nr:hypothetical protein [Phormidium tenue FACHB-886]
MKLPLSYQAYQQLELISSEKSTNKLSLGTRLNNVWQSLISYLAGSSEPHVWKTQAADGSHWQVFDPIAQRKLTFDSEADVRVWLEERHYQYGFASR